MHIVPFINIAVLVLVAVIMTATTQTQGVVGQQQQRLRMKRNRAAAGALRQEETMLQLNSRVDPTSTDQLRCENRKTEKFQIVGRQDERTCGWYVYRNMCDNSVTDDDGGNVVSDVCQKSCGKCGSIGRHKPASVDLPPPTPSLTKAIIIPPSSPPMAATTTDVGTRPTFAPTQTYNPTSTADYGNNHVSANHDLPSDI